MVDINKILALIVSVDLFVQYTAFCFNLLLLLMLMMTMMMTTDTVRDRLTDRQRDRQTEKYRQTDCQI